MGTDRQLAGILLAVGAGYLAATFLISEPEGQYAAVGPRAFPLVIGLALAACAAWIGLRRPGPTTEGVYADGRGPAAGAAALGGAAPGAAAFLVYIALLEPVGYLLATAVFIPVEARLLGSRAWRRDLIASLVITVSIYVVLGQVLGLRLPSGVLG